MKIENFQKFNLIKKCFPFKYTYTSYRNIAFAGLVGIMASRACTDVFVRSDSKEKTEYYIPAVNKFNSREDVLNYAIEKVKSPLNLASSYEYAVVIGDRTNTVKGEFQGDSTKVYLYTKADAYEEKESLTTLHGHYENANLYTPSFSFIDFKCLNNNDDVSTIVVVSKHGETFVLAKKEGFKKISKEELDKLQKEYYKEFDNLHCLSINDKDNKRVRIDYLNIHKFWLTVAEKYNLEYSTNYAKKLLNYSNVKDYVNRYYK